MSDEIVSPVQVDIDRDKIKRAVKEALDDKAIEDLGHQLTALSTQVAEGFAAVHARQDTANGKLLKHETQIISIESKASYDKVIWLIVTTLVGIVVFFLTKHLTLVYETTSHVLIHI